MKIKLLIFLLLINLFGTAQNLEWANTFCNYQVIDSLQTIAYHDGYIYTGGCFNGTDDFDPGSGVFNLTSNAYTDIFICKNDSAGNLIWAKQISTFSPDIYNVFNNSITIKIDGNGNIYAAGKFIDTLDIDPSPAVHLLIPNSGGNFYIAKFDSNGNFIWANQTSSSNSLWIKDFQIDEHGKLYVAGLFAGSVDINPGIGVFQLNSLSVYGEAFVCSYTNDGNFINSNSFPSKLSSINAMAIDSEKNLLLFGYFQDSIEFDPGVVVYHPRSVFVCKLDSLFAYQWSIYSSFTGIYNYPSSGGLCLDAFDNVYFSGEFMLADNFQFNSGADSIVLETDFPFSRTFIVKSDEDGNLKWAKTFGNQYHEGNKICPIINTDGLLYINGRFEAESDFDPGLDSSIHAGDKMYSFVEVLDTAGNFQNVIIIGNGTNNWVNITGMVNDENGNIYLTGDYGNYGAPIDIDPSVDIYNLADSNSIFLMKWGFGNYNNLPKFDVEKGLYIFPNPITLTAIVILKQNVNHAIAKIYNSMGQQVNEISNISGNSFSLSRENLKAGFYFIKLIENNKIIATEKFMLSDF